MWNYKVYNRLAFPFLYGSANSQDNSLSMLFEEPQILLQVQHVADLEEHPTWQPMAHVG